MLFSNVHKSMIVMNCGYVFLGRRIIDPSSFGSRCIKGTEESFPRADSSVYLIHRDPSHLESITRFRIFPKKCTLYIDTRFSRNVFEAVQKTRSSCFIGSQTPWLRLVVLNSIKQSCSCLNIT